LSASCRASLNRELEVTESPEGVFVCTGRNLENDQDVALIVLNILNVKGKNLVSETAAITATNICSLIVDKVLGGNQRSINVHLELFTIPLSNSEKSEFNINLIVRAKCLEENSTGACS
jgi:hypothetical protein